MGGGWFVIVSVLIVRCAWLLCAFLWWFLWHGVGDCCWFVFGVSGGFVGEFWLCLSSGFWLLVGARGWVGFVLIFVLG